MRRYKLDKTLMMLGSIFAMIGTLILVLCVIFTLKHIRFRQTAQQAQAVINEIETYYTYSSKGEKQTHHRVYVSYTVDGTTYENVLNYYDITMKEGGEITVYYAPGHPGDLGSTNTAECIIFGIFALIFGGIGYGIIISQIKLSAYINSLIAQDKFLLGEDYSEEKSGTRVNNVRYLQLVVTCHDSSGMEYKFKSHPYYPNKPPFTPGQPVRVYVDTALNPKKYYVCEE